MYTPVVASSPLAVRASGTSSYRRSASSRGAVGTSAPRPVGSLLQTADSSSALFSLLSGSARDVRSSPTDGSAAPSSSCAGPSCVQSPATQLVGFNVSSGTAPQQSSCNKLQQAATPKGLLSAALGATHLPEPRFGGIAAQCLERHGYFPDVDQGLLRDLQERHPVFHTDLVVTAYGLAAKAHEGQLRKDGTSQLSHCVMTALQLAELGLDAETVAAGLLHEALRYNNAASFRSQMEEFMPSAVVQLVERVTTISEISQLYRNNPDALGEEYMRRMLLAMEDVKAVLIKLACRVHNMRTIGALPADKQLAFARETLDVFAVVANRLGVWGLKAQLEDLAFSVLHPQDYEVLKEQVAARQDPEVLGATIERIRESLDARGVKYEDISGRPKNLYSIYCKMREGRLTSLDQVFDVVALRVVVTNKTDCYMALRCVQEAYASMPSRSKDFIKEVKKPNGYQSLHETIYGEGGMPVEVQIRTHKMHYIAEYGFAAHWKYKEKLSDEDEWLDKEVHYKKWLTTYKLGLNDMKVRALGAPQHDTALTSLGLHLLEEEDVQQQGEATLSANNTGRGYNSSLGGPASNDRNSRNTSGGSGLRGVDPFLRHDRFRLQAPTKQRVAVVVQTQDSIESRELSVECTAGALSRQLGLQQLPGYVMLVNQRLAPPSYRLRSGDLVQVVPESSVATAGVGCGGVRLRSRASAPLPSASASAPASPATPTPMTFTFSRPPLAQQQQQQPQRAAGVGVSVHVSSSGNGNGRPPVASSVVVLGKSMSAASRARRTSFDAGGSMSAAAPAAVPSPLPVVAEATAVA